MDWFEKTLLIAGAAWVAIGIGGLLFSRKPGPGDIPTGALHEGRAKRE